MVDAAVHRVRVTIRVDVRWRRALTIGDLLAILDRRVRRVATSTIHDKNTGADAAGGMPARAGRLQVAGALEVGECVAARVIAARTEAGGEVGSWQVCDVAVLVVIAASELRIEVSRS